MCSIIALLMLVVGGWAGFSTLSTETVSAPQSVQLQATPEIAQVATEAFSCASPPADQDTSAMLALAGNLFDPTIWSQSISSEAYKNSATWTSDTLGALAYVEYLHYDCGVTQADIDTYFSPSNFQIIFSNYTTFTQTDECESNGVRLLQFDATVGTIPYHVNYWIEQVTSTRLADLMLVFPLTQKPEYLTYAARWFPDLATCKALAQAQQ